MKKGWITAAVILVVVGAVLFAGGFIASGFDFSVLDTAGYETNTCTVSERFNKIEIRSNEAEIVFKRSEDGKTRVDCVEREKTRHDVFVENGTLKVAAVDRREWYDHLTLFSFKHQSVTVYLPSEYYEALSVITDTGNVSVPEGFSFGEAEVRGSTGDVTFGAAVDGRLKITTSTGAVRVRGVRAKSIDLTASTGRIDAAGIECREAFSAAVSTGRTVLTDIPCQTLFSGGSTGSVAMKNVIASDSFTIERNTGDVTFEKCDAGEITVSTSTGDVKGTLLSEKVFIAKTSSGRIDVPETISGGKCSITTSTGDISIALDR